jgi:hypothetical protein
MIDKSSRQLTLLQVGWQLCARVGTEQSWTSVTPKRVPRTAAANDFMDLNQVPQKANEL